MIESLFILLIIFLFIMPIPTLAMATGLGIGHLFYKQFLLFRYQPASHKNLIWCTLLCNGINFFLSLFLALAMSYAVHYFLTDLFWLFLFNFLFCFAVSLRWFDFSNRLFRYLVHRLSEKHTRPLNTTGQSTFVMIYGLQKSIGWGAGWTPVFVDAGIIDLTRETLRFRGLFLDMTLGPQNLENAISVSSEQITLIPRRENEHQRVGRYKLVVRDQFYPFRCRETRDLILSRIFSTEKTQTNVPAPTLPR